jgi:uncharacterized protein involved in response to NO
VLNRWQAWSAALTVTVITALLVILDISDRSVHRYWSRHSFTSSVLAGVLVLLLTVLLVDRVVASRELKNQSRAIGAQAALIAAQAQRAVQAVTQNLDGKSQGSDATTEVQTYTVVLSISASLFINSSITRAFLEDAQRLAAELIRALRPSDGADSAARAKQRLDQAVARLRRSAKPMLAALNEQQRAAIESSPSE